MVCAGGDMEGGVTLGAVVEGRIGALGWKALEVKGSIAAAADHASVGRDGAAATDTGRRGSGLRLALGTLPGAGRRAGEHVQKDAAHDRMKTWSAGRAGKGAPVSSK